MIKGAHLHFVFNYSWAAIAHELGHLCEDSSLSSSDTHSCTYAHTHTHTHTSISWDVTWCVLPDLLVTPVCVHCCAWGCRSLQVHVGIIRLCWHSGWGSNVLIRLLRSAKAQTVTLTVWFISMETREKLWSNYPYCCHLRPKERAGWHE